MKIDLFCPICRKRLWEMKLANGAPEPNWYCCGGGHVWHIDVVNGAWLMREEAERRTTDGEPE